MDMKERKIKMTYPNADVKEDTVYVCRGCKGVFIPQGNYVVHA
jgi:hypothetical protein